MSDPVDHHYLPAFYLKRWAGKDGRVVEFRRWPSGVKDLFKYPTATGFERNLYKAQEINFFRKVDTDAADALVHIERCGGGGSWPDRLRQGWVKFVFTLTLRSPEQMGSLRDQFARVAHQATAEHRLVYESMRKPEDPLTPEEWLANKPPEYLEDSPLRLIPLLTQTQEINGLLAGFHWFVIDVDPRDHELMMTECPVRHTGLKRDDAYLVMPIGPRRAFWAVTTAQQEVRIREALRRKKTWVRDLNSDLVRGAHRLLIARTTAAFSFVQGNMGRDPVWASFQPARPRAQ